MCNFEEGLSWEKQEEFRNSYSTEQHMYSKANTMSESPFGDLNSCSSDIHKKPDLEKVDKPNSKDLIRSFLGEVSGTQRLNSKETEPPTLESIEKKCRKWEEYEDFILIESLSRSLPLIMQTDICKAFMETRLRFSWKKVANEVPGRSEEQC